MVPGTEVPSDHPVRQTFQALTERGSQQTKLADRELHNYLSNLLVDFIHVDQLYRMRDEHGRRLEYIVDMLRKVEEHGEFDKNEIYKQVGDFSLFILGLFPESLHRGRKCISLNYYADQGRRSYLILSETQRAEQACVTFRKLSEQYESCVHTLNWVRNYISDPFYQYMLREFDCL
ncbi:MAG: hypothetical protein U0V70_07525 [Terriglobia bacterium]